jgi:predicted amidohydrolase
MSKLPLRLQLFPIDLAWADPIENTARMEQALSDRLTKSSLPSEETIAIFPEMTLTGFMLEGVTPLANDAEPVLRARALARKYKTAMIFGYPEKSDSHHKPWNRLELVDAHGNTLCAYRKKRLFTRGSPSESDLYSVGELEGVTEYRGWKLALRICFDLRFAELFDPLRKQGIDLVVLSACWLGGPHKAEQFRVLSASRAISAQCYFAALNRSGSDPNAQYEGDAHVFRPQGSPMELDFGATLLDPRELTEARKLKLD